MADLNTQLVFGANTAGAEAGVRTVRRSLKELADTATSAGKSIEGVGDRAGKSLEGMGDGAEVAARKIQRDTNSMKGSLQRYLSTLEAGSKDSRRYWESMADFKGIDKTALRPLLDQLDAYNAKAKGAQETTTSWVGSLSRMGASAAGVAAVAATAGVAAKAMFDASASAERLRTMLDFSTGGNSGKEIEYLRGVTYRLGLEFASTAKAYGQFSAAAKGTTLEGDKARAVFESVAKASAVMGLSASDTSGVLLALQQMLSKGTVSAEELRGQLGERLPGSFQVAAKAMGVTTAELGKMLEQGEVIADDFLPKFAAALEKNIGGASEKAAQRLDASVNRVATAWERLKQNGGDSGTSSFMAGQYEILADGFNGISEAMERARASGSGFVGQMVSGAVAAAKFANPLQAVSYSAIETGNALKQAESEFAALQKRGDVMGGNIYYKAEMANLAALIKELKAAQAEKQKLATGAAPNMNEGVTASGSAREAYNNQRAKDMEAANAFRLNQAGVPASYLKDMAELIRLNQAGVIVGKEYNDALKKQQDILLQKTGVTKGAAAAANQEQNTYETLVASIRTKIAANEAEISGAGRLTESDKLRIKLMEELKVGSKTLTAEHKERALALLDILSAQEKEEARIKSLVVAYKQEAEVAEEIAQAYVTQTKAREAGRAVVDSYVNGIDESNKALQYELSLMGLGTSAREVALEQYRIELDLKKQIAAIDANTGFDAAQREEERARARAGAAIAKANAASKAFLDEWKTSVSKYDDIFRKGFADMLNNGKDGWKSFTQSLVTTFKTTVADQIYKMFAQPIVVKLVGSMLGFTGASGAANAATGGSNLLGTALQGTSLYNGLTSGTGVLGSIGNAIGLGVGASTTMGGLGATAIGSYAAPSVAAMTIAPGATAAGAGGMSGALAAIPGWGWALAGVALLGSLANKFDDSGTYHTGGAAQYNAATGLRTSLGFRDNEEGLPSYNPNDNIDNQFGTGFGYVERGDQTISAVSGIAQGLGATLDGVAVAFGEKAGYAVATAFADDTSKDGAWGALRISKDGADLLNWNDTRESKWAPREFANGEEGYKEYLAEIAKDTRKVLLDMDLPSWADTMLESIGDAANMEQLSATVQQIGVVQTTFVQLGKTMEGFAGLTDQAFEALMRASGGFESLAANAGTYYENFYSEAEKTAAVTRSVSDALAQVGLAMPTTRDEFRALVESQLALGESGAEAVAALLGVSGAFASVVPAAAEATASLQAQAEAMEGLQIKLLRAQGNELAAVAIERQKELAALQAFGPAAVAMQQQIYGIMDAMSALESGAAAYFAGVDRQQAAEDYTDQGSDALSKFFGTAADASAGAAASAAQASADAASTAAASWRSAAQSIQAAIDGIRAGTTDLMDPAARYALTKATLDALTVSAMGGDVDAADKLAGAADDFLKASETGSTSQAQYLRDRVLAEAKLASVMESSKAQISAQDSIASSASAAVDQLTAMNANLTGFSAQVYELLSKSYQGADRATAGAAAAGLAAMQANFESYFRDTSAGQVGELAGGMGQLTRLDGGVGAYTNAAGDTSYFRSSESALDIAKRIPEFRAIWEEEFGLKLPAYAVGTNYVPQTGPALLHEGEAVIPKAFNPWAGGGQGNGEMLAELRALRQTNERLEARLASIEESNRDMATLLDNVTGGGNAMRSEVMA